jgi:Gti1/Pac2 family transcription factor
MAITMSNESDPYAPPPTQGQQHGSVPHWSPTGSSTPYGTGSVVRRPSSNQLPGSTYDYTLESSYSRRPAESISEAPPVTYHSITDQSSYLPPAHQPYALNTSLHLNTHLSPQTPSPQNLLSGVTLPPSASGNTLPPLDGENTLQPTWRGFVHTAWDAAMVVEACLDGTLIHCPRRPHDRERQHVIRSGSVFVYEALASGIKRWTDGLTWSPSRINGNFLVYRELNDNVQQGSKRRTAKRSRLANSRESSSTNLNGSFSESAPRATTNEDRPYIGSLSDSYDFKPGGLVKKTISFSVRNHTHHVICYYTLEEAKGGMLPRPQQDSTLMYKDPRPELREPRNFKAGPHHPDEPLSFYPVVQPHHQQYAQYYPPQPPPGSHGYMVPPSYQPVSMPVPNHQSMSLPGQQYDQEQIRYDGYT